MTRTPPEHEPVIVVFVFAVAEGMKSDAGGDSRMNVERPTSNFER